MNNCRVISLCATLIGLFVPFLNADTLVFKDGRVCHGKLTTATPQGTLFWQALLQSPGGVENFHIPEFQAQSVRTEGTRPSENPVLALKEMEKLPRMSRADCEPIRIAGAVMTASMLLAVKLVDPIDSKSAQVGTALRGVVLSNGRGGHDAEGHLKVVELGSASPGGGYSELKIALESAEVNGVPLPLENTVLFVGQDTSLAHETERTGNTPETQIPQAAGRRGGKTKESAGGGPRPTTDRQIDELFGTTDRTPVFVGAGATLYFTIGQLSATTPASLGFPTQAPARPATPGRLSK